METGPTAARKGEVARLVALSACLVVTAAAWAGAAEKTPLMAVSEVKRGMIGRGLTVLQGTQAEEFRVEILGVLERAWPRGDMILARLQGAGLEKSGVVAGMSGSPVYVDGRLIGAIAYTWGFAKEPLCGISPVHQMLQAFQPQARENVVLARSRDWAEPLPAVPRLPLGLDDPWLPPERAPQGPRRIVTPLLVSSYSPRIMDHLAPMLERFNLTPVQSGGGGGAPRKVDLVPGSVMGVQMIGGDMDVSALGTATLRDGDRVLGFGHPLFESGACDLPLTGGYVHFVMPSQQFSFKLTSTSGVVGRLSADYAFGVAGEMGKPPATVPCTVTVRNRSRDRTEVYRYSLARSRQWTWFLTGWVIAASVAKTEAASSEQTLAVRVEAKIPGRRSLVIRERLFSAAAPTDVMSMAWLVRLVWENPWEDVQVGSVEAEIDLVEGRKTARVVGMRLSADAARAGEEVSAFVRLQPHKSPQIIEKEVRVRVPPLAPAGSRVGVIACDAVTSAMLSRLMAPGRYRPVNFDQMARLIEELPSGDELAVRVTKPGQGVTFEGDALPDLPESARSVLAGTARTGLDIMREDTVTRMKTPWVVEGGAFLPLRVKADDEP